MFHILLLMLLYIMYNPYMALLHLDLDLFQEFVDRAFLVRLDRLLKDQVRKLVCVRL